MKNLLLSICLFGSSALAAEKPNILIILADDLGYADLGIYGCEDVPTPHLDSIGKNGVQFTSGYATHPSCSPSRAGLMAGQYQHRFGFENNSGSQLYAAPNFGVPTTVPLLSEGLKALGYQTGMAGKWHIGYREELRPNQRGFDSFYGFLGGARSYFTDIVRPTDDPLLRDNRVLSETQPYLTDAFADEAVRFINKAERGAPWFFYLAFSAVHTPMQAKESDLEKFSAITDPNRRSLAAMLFSMDEAVGRVLKEIESQGQQKDTLIFFYSDNGGIPSQNASLNTPLRGAKGLVYEGGIRVPFLMQWPGKIASGQVDDRPVMGFDCFATALAAAGVSDENIGGDGVNLLPYIRPDSPDPSEPHQTLVWRLGRQIAVRSGDWKIVVGGDSRGTPELYQVKDDISETSDLASTHPEKVTELRQIYGNWNESMMAPAWIRQDSGNAEEGGKLKPASKRISPLEKFFPRLDRNRDGKLTMEEFPRKDRFAEIDQNQDGGVTIEEVRAAFGGAR
jgi:arylsulfatase A-like enzyme